MDGNTTLLAALCILFFGSTCMIFARKWKNSDKDTGYAIAGWTILIALILIAKIH